MELVWFFLVFLVITIGVAALYEVRILNIKRQFDEELALQFEMTEEAKTDSWQMGYEVGVEETLKTLKDVEDDNDESPMG